MKIIITHEGTDFDGLAAMIAAKKIYPDAIPVFPGYLSTQVKDFMALFKDHFDIKRPKDINFEEVTEIILVDTKDPSRVGPFGELLFKKEIKKIIYDHHLLDNEVFNFEFEDHTSPVGSTTTILVEKLKILNIPISSIEATLFALGIYHDTGCLTYSTTTASDAEMVAYLLRNGAGLNVVEEFVQLSLTEAQQEVLNLLFDNMENLSINGLRIDIYTAVLKEYLLGINNIIHKLREIRNADVYFVIVEMENRVLIVGRSDVESVHLGEFLKELGGGGHAGAASAVIKGVSLDEALKRIKMMLKKYIHQPRMVKDIMTTPVKTIRPDASVKQAEEIMVRYGHTGLVVMDEEGIKGIFSRRDLDKLKKHNLSDVPIKGYMTRKVITVSLDAPVFKVQNLMVTHDIGRLPVVDETGQLVGIVTRSDLLKVLYGDSMVKEKSYYGSSLVKVNPRMYNLETYFTQCIKTTKIFSHIRDLGERSGVKPYLVGGFVRDLLLKRPSKDLDIVVEGDGIFFAEKLHEIIGGKLSLHREFKTASIVLDDFVIDIVTARVEYYEYPAALPQVEPAFLKQDLYRRDLTINTLAISLCAENYGWLVDIFGGKDDLEKGIIRGLHSFTFIDDPTRILRAIKFAVRFDFIIEADTDLLIREAIQNGIFKRLTGQRLWDELKSLLMEKRVEQAIWYLEDYDILKEIYPDLRLTHDQWKQIKRIDSTINLLNKEHQFQIQRWLLVLMIVFSTIAGDEIAEKFKNKGFSSQHMDCLLFAAKDAQGVLEKLTNCSLEPDELYDLLNPLAGEKLIYLGIISDSRLVNERLMEYINHLINIKVETTGRDLIAMGYSPGPLFKEVMAMLKKAKLKGEIGSKKEEIDFIEEYLKKKDGDYKNG